MLILAISKVFRASVAVDVKRVCQLWASPKGDQNGVCPGGGANTAVPAAVPVPFS